MLFDSKFSFKVKNIIPIANINTTSPNANLHVGSSNAVGDAANPAIQIGGSSTYRAGLYTSAEGFILDNANGDDGIIFHTKTAGQMMRLQADGVVHITSAGAPIVPTIKFLYLMSLILLKIFVPPIHFDILNFTT